MECNKDEATRAKSIAEGKFEQKDYVSAKKFALKAQSLYPGLDGISQMLTTLEVYESAENKIRGEMNWYGVLGVNPLADDETLKRQYRKLALMVHPDKNNCVGAEGAFKLISQAWNFLSDKTKRLEYNNRMGGFKGSQRNVPAPAKPSQQVVRQSGGPSAPSAKGPGPSAGSNCGSRESSAAKPLKVPVPKKRTPAPSADTFWTTCNRCSMQFEYAKMFCNCTLLCRNCQMPFKALETVPPAKFRRPAKQVRRSSVRN